MQLLFATPGYEELANRMLKSPKGRRHRRGKLQRDTFPDGEQHLTLASRVRGKDVTLIGGLHSDAAIVDLIFQMKLLVARQVNRMNVVVPYFRYSTQERAVKPREAVTAKYVAEMLSGVKEALGGTTFFFLDLHSEGLPHYLNDRSAYHVYAEDLWLRVFRQVGGKDFVIGGTDGSRVKWIDAYVRRLSADEGLTVDIGVALKRRIGGKSEVYSFTADVKGRIVIVFDDMIRTGGSVRNVVELYRKAGAKAVYVVSTHGVLPGDSLEKIQKQGIVKCVYVTDSHPRAVELAKSNSKFVKLVSVGDLLARAISDPDKLI